MVYNPLPKGIGVQYVPERLVFIECKTSNINIIIKAHLSEAGFVSPNSIYSSTFH